MMIGLLGDIHGDARALEAALRRLDELGADHLLCTGDLIGYGSQNDTVVDMMRERNIPTIRGNHERWALERRQVIGLRGWQPARLRDETWELIAGLPPSARFQFGTCTIELHHGSPASDVEFVTPYKPIPASIENYWTTGPARVLVLGHTHIPMIERDARGLLVNPGSVLGVPGIQTSYSFATLNVEEMAVRVHDIRLGWVIRRDPVWLPD